MESRKPLSVIIAMQGKKPPTAGSKADTGGYEPDGDEGDDSNPKYDDDAMVSACEDAIDAFKNRDATALNRALCHWIEAHGPVDDSSSDSGDTT